jgi:thiosulfate sulfurtransferase
MQARPDHASTTPSITVEELARWLASGRPVQLLDVRRTPAFEKNPKVIRGAIRVLPDDVRLWPVKRDEATPVVAYCVYGHEVSQGAAAELIGKGLNASFLVGGISEWERQGNPTSAVDA